MEPKTHQPIERAARETYGRLIAILSRRTGDIHLAEDLLSSAFEHALKQWPTSGIPSSPEAWLLTVAKRKHIDVIRKQATQKDHAHDLRNLLQDMYQAQSIPDERMPMLFLCAHPGIDPDMHAPLMLQVVMGLNAEQIGRAFLVKAATMGQRLSRVKRKIRKAGIPFDLSDETMKPERLRSVLEALYGAYSIQFSENQDHSGKNSLAEETLWLARLVHETNPEDPEAYGLLSLLMFIHSRIDARVDMNGVAIPVDQQNIALWNEPMILEAEAVLNHAASFQSPGRFQIEAAIQSAHAARRFSGTTDWKAIRLLYEALLDRIDSRGVQIAYLATCAEIESPTLVYQKVTSLDEKQFIEFLPYWALRADLEDQLGIESTKSYKRAIRASKNSPLSTFLTQKQNRKSITH